ncbi:MAG: GDP-mannose 4,6-dehydratase [Thermomicrobia bacterium]|nr:GDP-mannose 4,6-dehydratase [Thermomicrobia bacterium]MCA1722968.1 GDP-mannose 4,6-dehydratase [Thermomicrobia bacterium]
MRVLVTGGAGFIGSHVVEALLARGDAVIALDCFSDFLYSAARKRRNLARAAEHPHFSLQTADITDAPVLQRIFAEAQPESVIHLAGMAAVGPSVGRAALYTNVNVLGSINVLDAAVAAHVRHVVVASSSTVYGDTGGVAFREDQPLRPMSPYGATKAAVEAMAQSYTSLHDLPITALRFFNAYGPRVRPDLATYRFVDAVHRGIPIQLRGDGSVQRDYTYIGDTVAGILAALDAPDGFRVFNLGNEHPIVIRDLIQIIERIVERPALIAQQPALRADLPITFADNSKARAALGYNPTTEITSGIARLYDWYRTEEAAGD